MAVDVERRAQRHRLQRRAFGRLTAGDLEPLDHGDPVGVLALRRDQRDRQWPVGAHLGGSQHRTQRLVDIGDDDAEHVARARQVRQFAIGAAGDADRAVVQPLQPQMPAQMVLTAGGLAGLDGLIARPHRLHTDRRRHRRAAAQDAPRIAPGDDQRVEHLAVPARIVGDHSVGVGQRVVERHPAGDRIAEAFREHPPPSAATSGRRIAHR